MPDREPNGSGDCFVVAASIMLETDGDGMLVHGRPLGRGGNAKGLRYWHAWVESSGYALDLSNGLRVALPIEVYYAMGGIDAAACRRYTQAEAKDQMRIYQHYGPWDEDHPPA